MATYAVSPMLEAEEGEGGAAAAAVECQSLLPQHSNRQDNDLNSSTRYSRMLQQRKLTVLSLVVTLFFSKSTFSFFAILSWSLFLVFKI